MAVVALRHRCGHIHRHHRRDRPGLRPRNPETGKYFTATASYSDGEGSDKTAKTATAVVAPSQTLASNMSKSQPDGSTVQTSNNQSGYGQSFSTGTDADGYTLHAVKLQGQFFSDATVRVHTDDSGKPGSVVATLTDDPSLTTSSLSALGVYEFTAPGGGVALEPGAIYWVAMEAPTQRGGWTNTTSLALETITPRWTIGNTPSVKNRDTGVWSALTPARPFKMELRGAPGPLTTADLVSNLPGIVTPQNSLIDDDSGFAQSFTTGPAGGTFHAATLRADLRSSGTVKLHADSSGLPGDVLATLAHPDNLSNSSNHYEFTADGGVELEAGATYWVAVEGPTGAGTWRSVGSIAESGVAGWSLGDHPAVKSRSASTWALGTGTGVSSGNALAMAVRGSVGRQVLLDSLSGTDRADVSTVSGTGRYGQSFTTSGRARLDAVVLNGKFSTDTVVTLFADVSGEPGSTSLAVLAGRAGLTATLPTVEADWTFKAPSAGVGLEAQTRYWLVVSGAGEVTTAASVVNDPANNSGADGLPGWTVDAFSSYDGSAWSDAGAFDIRMALAGSPPSPPSFHDTAVTRQVSAAAAAGDALTGGPVAVVNADGDTLTYTVAATTDTDGTAHLTAFNHDFLLDAATGQITVNTAAAIDHDTRNAYKVVLQVADSEDDLGAVETTAVVDDTVTLTIDVVVNPDEPGTVTITGNTQAGVPSTAWVTDPDGKVSDLTWQWSRSDTATGTFTDITGATGPAYIPRNPETGKYFTATASYTDGHGSDKTATATTAVVAPSQTLASNLGETDRANAQANNIYSGFAQSFSTGADTDGYTLHAVKLKGSFFPDATVRVHTDDSGSPGGVVATLTDPPTRVSLGANEFTAPADGVALEAGTAYWVTVEAPLQRALWTVTESAAQETITPDWSIGDNALKKNRDTGAWSVAWSDRAFKMELRGASGPLTTADLVGNLPGGTRSRVALDSSDSGLAQSFTAGPAGGTFHSVSLLGFFGDEDAVAGSPPNYTVKLHADSSGLPGDALAALADPDNPDLRTALGAYEFTAPVGGVELEPGATYWVAVEGPTGAVNLHSFGSIAESGVEGWSLGDHPAVESRSASTWALGTGSTVSSGNALAMTVRGSVGRQVLLDSLSGTDRAAVSTVSGTGRFGQSFTTSGRARLDAVVLNGKFSTATVVSLFTDDSGEPGTSLAVLADPAGLTATLPTAEADWAFKAPSAGVDLEAATRYWLVVSGAGEVTTAASVVNDPANNHGASGLPYWTVDAFSSYDGTVWTDSGASDIRMALAGSPPSPPSFHDTAATRQVAAEAASGDALTGGPVAVVNADGDTLTYTVAATADADGAEHLTAFNRDFLLDTATGEITVNTTAAIDHATRSAYKVVLGVADSEDGLGAVETTAAVDDTLTLTIDVVKPDAPGTLTISGPCR